MDQMGPDTGPRWAALLWCFRAALRQLDHLFNHCVCNRDGSPDNLPLPRGRKNCTEITRFIWTQMDSIFCNYYILQSIFTS